MRNESAAEMFTNLQQRRDALDMGMINRLVMEFRRGLEPAAFLDGNLRLALIRTAEA
jgi:hypothetical protein